MSAPPSLRASQTPLGMPVHPLSHISFSLPYVLVWRWDPVRCMRASAELSCI